MSVHHELKIETRFMDRVLTGQKRFEIRKADDRDFQVGDTFTLIETVLPSFRTPSQHAADSFKFAMNHHHHFDIPERRFDGEITYICDYQQKQGYVVFGFKELKRNKGEDHDFREFRK